MAKIKITESELRELIRESVETELNETGFNATMGNMWRLGINGLNGRANRWGYDFDAAKNSGKTRQEIRKGVKAQKQAAKNAGFRASTTPGQAYNKYVEVQNKLDNVSNTSYNTLTNSINVINNLAQSLVPQQAVKNEEKRSRRVIKEEGEGQTQAQGAQQSQITQETIQKLAGDLNNAIKQLQTNIDSMKKNYAKEIETWKGRYNTLMRQQQSAQKQQQTQAGQQQVAQQAQANQQVGQINPATVTAQKQTMPNINGPTRVQTTNTLNTQISGRPNQAPGTTPGTQLAQK